MNSSIVTNTKNSSKDALLKVESPIKYSIGTLVNDFHMYSVMKESFYNSGFTENHCEFLFINNSQENTHDAYRGLNIIISNSQGKYILLCHQDVLTIDTKLILDERLSELDKIDGNWAIAGNAGFNDKMERFIRISDPHMNNAKQGDLPAKVLCLDENFLVIRKDALIGFSRDLHGFHFYGTDIVLQAKIRGFNSYVIDFHLHHLSGGKIDKKYWESAIEFEKKYLKAIKPLKKATWNDIKV